MITPINFSGQTNKNTAFTALAQEQKQPARAVQKPVYDKNPIKKSGERSNAILATVAAGGIFGLRLLAALADDGDGGKFIGEFAGKISEKILKRNSKPGQKITFLNQIGGFVAVLAAMVGVFAAIYTIYNLPKAMYKADVNTFKKGKEMDVYIRGNAVEQELYNQMNDKAKEAKTAEEKAKLNEQYMKLKASKNIVPDFVQLKQKNLIEAQNQG